MSFQVSINNNEQYPIITLTDDAANCYAEIYAFGAILNKFGIQNETLSIQVVDAFNSVQEAIDQMVPGFKSSFLSPFTCRMNKGTYQYNNSTYTIQKFYLAPHAIHGLVYDSVYSVVHTLANEHSASVQLRTEYRGTDAGYPFSYFVNHIWKLQANNQLSVYTFVQNANKVPIPYAQGWHPYFTFGHSINDCTLQFDSNQMLVFDNTLLPTGEIITDTRFQQATQLKDTFLDNCFQLSKGNPSCTLSNNKVQLIITPDEAYPFLQVYTPPHRNSIAIENLSGAPDCFNNEMGLLHIPPSQMVEFTTSYQLKPL